MGSTISHIDNLPSILRFGLLSQNELRSLGIHYTSVALEGVQDLRRRIWLQLPGHQKGRQMPNLHDFVPFYFVQKTPMLWVLRDIQDNIVFVVATTELLSRQGTLFTDGNAAVQGLWRSPNLTVVVTVSTDGAPCCRTFFCDGFPIQQRPRQRVSEIYTGIHNLQHLKWEILAARSWVGFEDGKRARCSEVSVPSKVKLADIRELAVRPSENAEHARGLVKNARADLSVVCRPDWYFPNGRAAPAG